jgi:LysR family pca operon transcriptional activator
MIVSLSKLRQLVTIARSASLSRAAEELRISQPALSRNVAFIEDAYGVKIFDRTPQGVIATQAGSAIIGEAERLLRSAEAFNHNAELIGGGKLGEVTFGMGPILGNVLAAKIGITLLTGDRQISFRIQTRRADDLINALIHEDLELAFIGQAFHVPDEIEARSVGRMRTAAIVRPDHPLVGQRKVGIDQVANYPVASPLDLKQLQLFKPIPHHISCDDYNAMKEMVVATDTICFCAEIFARQAWETGEVAILDFDMPAPQREFEVLAMTLKGRTSSPAVELVVDCCRAILASAS